MPAKLMSDVSSPQAMPEHVRSITLIRHGRTSYNARHCFQGQIDIPLDEIGEWQVRQTAQALRSLYVESHPERRQLVVASDLSRAMATAHAFADPLGLVVHPDARVRERNFGEWEGKELAELERECPEDYRAWAEYRGGELRHGAETKAAVGERGRAALEEWSFSAGADTDLYVFSHGSWIAQTVQTVLGLGAIHPDFADVVSMGNAHWVRFVAADMPDGTLRWRLVDYNHGPALADTDSGSIRPYSRLLMLRSPRPSLYPPFPVRWQRTHRVPNDGLRWEHTVIDSRRRPIMAKNIADGDIIWTQRKRNWCRTPFTFTTYTLTADELATQSGLLHQSFDTVKLFRIVDITISRTLLQRIFGLSTILIDAMDQSTGGKIVLKNIIDGFAVRKELQHAVDAARNVNRVSTREFMGTGDGYYGGPDGPDLDGDGYPDFPAR